jgi:hypothetical protein
MRIQLEAVVQCDTTESWFDKREVTMLSTMYESKMIHTRKTHYKTNGAIQKPVPVKKYNENRGCC